SRSVCRRPARLALFSLSLHDALPILPYAVGMLLVVVAAVYLSFFLSPNTIGGATFLWLALGFALVTYCNAFLVLRAFRDLPELADRQSTRLNSSHVSISYAVFCLKKI